MIDQQVSRDILGRKFRDEFHLNTISVHTYVQQKVLRLDYYNKEDHALIYFQYLVAND